MRPLDIVLSKKKILDRKTKILQTVYGNALVQLTPPFHLCDPLKLRYRRKTFWTEKRKFSQTVKGNALVPLTPLLAVRPPEIEISKKNFLDRKTILLVYFFCCRVCTIDTSLSPERSPEIEISKKKFKTEKRKFSNTFNGNTLVLLTPLFLLFDLQKSRY